MNAVVWCCKIKMTCAADWIIHVVRKCIPLSDQLCPEAGHESRRLESDPDAVDDHNFFMLFCAIRAPQHVAVSPFGPLDQSMISSSPSAETVFAVQCSYFPFGFEGRMWDLIVSVPDHCLPFYFAYLH